MGLERQSAGSRRGPGYQFKKRFGRTAAPAAINLERLARHVATFVSRQKNIRACHIAHFSSAAERRKSLAQLFPFLSAAQRSHRHTRGRHS